MAPVHDVEAVALVDKWPGVAVRGGGLGQAEQDVDLGNRRCRRGDAPDELRQALEQDAVQLALETDGFVVRARHARLHLLELGRHEALGVGQRLLRNPAQPLQVLADGGGAGRLALVVVGALSTLGGA